MSERKGGEHKTPRKNIKIGEDSHAKLLKYAQSSGLKMSVILEEFIAKGVKYDITDQNWIEKLRKFDERVNRYAGLDGACDGLAYGEDEEGKGIYSCVWFREGRPPQIRILGKTESLMISRCAACGRTEEIAKGFKERDLRIRELEVELGSKSSERLKIPKCNRGAVLNHDKEDNLIFTGCFRHRGEPVSVDKFCRVYHNGLPCSMFAEIVVGVEGKR